MALDVIKVFSTPKGIGIMLVILLVFSPCILGSVGGLITLFVYSIIWTASGNVGLIIAGVIFIVLIIICATATCIGIAICVCMFMRHVYNRGDTMIAKDYTHNY